MSRVTKKRRGKCTFQPYEVIITVNMYKSVGNDSRNAAYKIIMDRMIRDKTRFLQRGRTTEMKQILDYFMIDGEVGGNQDWFRNVVMHIGGCAAATACDCCIYFAKYKGKKNLYPFDAENLSKEDYIQFSMKMKPYLRPRMSGVNKLWMYTEGFGKYLEDIGEKVEFKEFSGEHTAREAAVFIKKKINEGTPVPYLMLRHKDKKFADFVWHWFLCIGYEETADDLLIKVATYGEAATFSLKELWNTGYKEKGGLIGITVHRNL